MKFGNDEFKVISRLEKLWNPLSAIKDKRTVCRIPEGAGIENEQWCSIFHFVVKWSINSPQYTRRDISGDATISCEKNAEKSLSIGSDTQD